MTCREYCSIIIFKLSTHLMQPPPFPSPILKHTMNECKVVQILHFRWKAIGKCIRLSQERWQVTYHSLFATAKMIFVNGQYKTS